jgi:hypothetical protein
VSAHPPVPYWKTIAKAIAGCLVAFLLALGTVMLDGDLVREEIIGAVGTGLTTGLAVYAVPNRKAY